MDEIEALSKRFKDFIDKVQSTLGKSLPLKPDQPAEPTEIKPSAKKLYTIISPVEAMSSNLQSVLDAIDKAMDNMEKLSKSHGEEHAAPGEDNGTQPPAEVFVSEPGKKKFTVEELDFLVRTFNTILNTPEEERKKLFTQFDNKESPPDKGT